MDSRRKVAHFGYFENDDEGHVIDDDSSDDEFWTLTTCAIVTIAEYYCNYIHKVPCMVSHQTGIKWMIEILEGHETRCLNMFRMKPEAFWQLCTILEGKYGLRSSRRMSFWQFTFVLAGYEGTAHDSCIFSKAIYTEKLKFPSPPPGKYYLVDAGYPNLKGYLGPYRGVRYHLPEFQCGQPPTGYQEIFNKAHSSLRSCIERTFGVWKKRWKILRDMPSYPFATQINIVLASMALHNFIRRYSLADPLFIRVDAHPNFVPRDVFQDGENTQSETSRRSSRSREMDEVRDQIAISLLARKNYE